MPRIPTVRINQLTPSFMAVASIAFVGSMFLNICFTRKDNNIISNLLKIVKKNTIYAPNILILAL